MLVLDHGHLDSHYTYCAITVNALQIPPNALTHDQADYPCSTLEVFGVLTPGRI